MTQNADMEKQKFPIGTFAAPVNYSQALLQSYKESIRDFPGKLRIQTQDLSDQQLDTPYREGGWTVRQVVHHCADSHMNGFIRLKLALSEDVPTIKPYPQDQFAKLNDCKMNVHTSLIILEGVHARWYEVLKSLKEPDLDRSYIHPEYGKQVPIKESIAQYAWHGEHHLAHITSLKKRMGWL